MNVKVLPFFRVRPPLFSSVRQLWAEMSVWRSCWLYVVCVCLHDNSSKMFSFVNFSTLARSLFSRSYDLPHTATDCAQVLLCWSFLFEWFVNWICSTWSAQCLCSAQVRILDRRSLACRFFPIAYWRMRMCLHAPKHDSRWPSVCLHLRVYVCVHGSILSLVGLPADWRLDKFLFALCFLFTPSTPRPASSWPKFYRFRLSWRGLWFVTQLPIFRFDTNLIQTRTLSFWGSLVTAGKVTQVLQPGDCGIFLLELFFYLHFSLSLSFSLFPSLTSAADAKLCQLFAQFKQLDCWIVSTFSSVYFMRAYLRVFAESLLCFVCCFCWFDRVLCKHQRRWPALSAQCTMCRLMAAPQYHQNWSVLIFNFS